MARGPLHVVSQGRGLLEPHMPEHSPCADWQSAGTTATLATAWFVQSRYILYIEREVSTEEVVTGRYY